LGKLFNYSKWANVQMAFEFLDSLVFVPKNFVPLDRFRGVKKLLKSEYVGFVTFEDSPCRFNHFISGKQIYFLCLF